MNPQGRLLLPCALLLLAVTVSARPAPVLYIPGLTGSALEGRKVGADKWQRLWVDLLRDSLYINSTLIMLETEWDSASNVYTNLTGTEVRSMDFGLVSGMDYLAKIGGIGVPGTDYAHKLIKFLVGKGYTPNVDLRGATYDWRLPRSELVRRGWFKAIESLVEEMRAAAGDTPVVVVGHCYGGVLLAEHWSSPEGPSQAWKDANIKAFVSVAAPFLGTMVPLEAVLSGSDDGHEIWGIPLLPLHLMRRLARTLGAMAALGPRKGMIADDAPLVVTSQRTYVSSEMFEAMTDAGALETVLQTTEMERLGYMTPAGHPGVRVVCDIGHGLNTTTAWLYDDADKVFEKKAKMFSGEDGDGKVTAKSAGHCLEWQAQRPDLRFDAEHFYGIGHVDIVKDSKWHESLWKVLSD